MASSFGAAVQSTIAKATGGHVKSQLLYGAGAGTPPSAPPPSPAPNPPSGSGANSGGGSAGSSGGGSGGGTTGGGGGSVPDPIPPASTDWGAEFQSLMNNFGATDSQLIGSLLQQQTTQATAQAAGYAPIFTPPTTLLNSLFIAGWPTSGNPS